MKSYYVSSARPDFLGIKCMKCDMFVADHDLADFVNGLHRKIRRGKL